MALRDMDGVTGIGGVFLKAKDPKNLYAWYEKHLGVKQEPYGGVSFRWSEDGDAEGLTTFAFFPDDTKYFAPSQASFMINFRVRDLDGLVERLRREGVEVDPKREDYDYGRFAWIMDPEGNKIELWEPRK